jgi:ribosomal subunit interface protein
MPDEPVPNTFEIEYHSSVEGFTDELKDKVAKRLQKLVQGKRDITGASVALEQLDGSTTPHAFRARVVIYQRPKNIAAIEKGETMTAALREALDAVERQVREQRERLRERWKRR